MGLFAYSGVLLLWPGFKVDLKLEFGVGLLLWLGFIWAQFLPIDHSAENKNKNNKEERHDEEARHNDRDESCCEDMCSVEIC